MSPRRARGLSAGAAALAAAGLAALAQPARAQTLGASVALTSDYRYRGHTLSDERPAASLNLAFDHRSGLYAGAELIAARTREHSLELVGYMDYAGFAGRPGGRAAPDLGVINYHLTSYRLRKRTADYTEVYAGFVAAHVSGHLYYAPDYYNLRLKTLYADLSASYRPQPEIKLFGHAGALTPVGGRNGPGLRKTHYDFKAGVAADRGPFEASLAWTHVGPQLPRGGGKFEPADALALTLAYAF